MKIPSSEQLKKQLAELINQMSDPIISRDVKKMKSLSGQHAEKKELLTKVIRLEDVRHQGAGAAELTEQADEELKELALQDIARLKKEEEKILNEIEESLLAHDPRDARNVILEIRAGAGGEEASLFAAQLYRAYARYAETHGWKSQIVNSSPSEQGGFKEVVAEITGTNVFGTLKFERGVHRVQRVPATEKLGRIHTSTVTVAVLPEAEEVDIDIKPEDIRIDTYRAGGAGGQHVNKTSSAVRLTHLPTNTVVAVQDERSQHKNKAKALKVLRSRLLEAQELEQHQQAADERREQVGTGDRSEKIRTYNFPQDRVTDHRIKYSWGNVESLMNGDLDPIFNDLQAEAKKRMLRQAQTKK